MKGSIHKTMVIALASFSIVGVISWIVLLYFLFNDVRDITILAKEAEEKIAEDKALSSVRLIANDVKENMARLDGAFIKGDAVASFVDALERESEEAHTKVTIDTLSLDSEVDKPIRNLSARISVTGDWKEVVSFLYRIETLPKVLLIDQVVLTKSDVDESGKIWKASFELITNVIK